MKQNNNMPKLLNIPKPMRKYLILGIQCAISITALAYALYGVDVTMLLRAIQGYSYIAIIAVLACIGLDYIAMTIRLKWLLPKGISYGICLRAILICIGYNNLLPAKAGDGLKIFFLKERTALPLLCIGSVILWERIFDVIILLAFAFLTYLLVDLPYSSALPTIIVFIGIVALYVLRRYSSFFNKLYAKIPHNGIAKILCTLHSEIIDKITYRWAIGGLFFSICIWILYFCSFVITLLYVGNFSLDITQLLTVFVVVSLGMAIPSTPGGLGIFEATMVLSLSWFNIARDEALGIALLLHALHFIPATLAALYIMLLEKGNNSIHKSSS